MIGIHIATIGIWLICGLTHLLMPQKISKFSYGLCWGVLMLNLVARLIETIC